MSRVTFHINIDEKRKSYDEAMLHHLV